MSIMTKYIDIHSHILPGVDDGAKDMEMTIQMVDAVYSQGIRTMIATPHYYPGHIKYSRESLEDTYWKTVSAIREKYSDFILLPGNEIYYRDEVVDKLNNKRIFTLAGSRYILLEFTPDVQYRRITEAVRRCVDSGYYPILAHIERYRCLWKNDKNIGELIRTGAYMQVNAENFMGGFFFREKRFCLKLIQNGLVHFIGSDCHNMHDRSPNLKQAMDYLEEKLTSGVFQKIAVENPARLLNDQYI